MYKNIKKTFLAFGLALAAFAPWPLQAHDPARPRPPVPGRPAILRTAPRGLAWTRFRWCIREPRYARPPGAAGSQPDPNLVLFWSYLLTGF